MSKPLSRFLQFVPLSVSLSLSLITDDRFDLISVPAFGAVSLMIYVIWHYKTGSRDKCSPPFCIEQLRVSPLIPSRLRLCSSLITLSYKTWIRKTTTTQPPWACKNSLLFCTQWSNMFMMFVCEFTGLCVCVCTAVRVCPLHACVTHLFGSHVCVHSPFVCVCIRK